jgi:tetratricopeptide (TPR) repeat protein
VVALALALTLAVGVPFPERAEDSRYLELEQLYHEDKPEEGVKKTRALLQTKPKDAELYVLLARFLYEIGERHKRDSSFDKESLYLEMVTLLEKARTLRPGDPRIGWGLGVAKARLGTTRGILASLRSAKEIEALWLDAANKGSKYRSLGGEEELPCDAYLTLGVFYRLIPDWWIVGLLAGTRGDLDKAIHWLNKADECSPNKIRVLKELAVGQLCYADRRDDSVMAKRGQETLRRLLKLEPDQETDRIDVRHARYLLAHPRGACSYSRDGQQDLEKKALKKQ